MTRLDTELKYQGRTLKQIKRQGRIALYELYGANGLLYGYELIVIKIAPEEEIFGKTYPERELYPSSSKNSDDWGKIAWSFGISENQKQRAFDGFTTIAKETQGGRDVSHFFASEGTDSGPEVAELYQGEGASSHVERTS
jgi:hypothetical protein